IWDALPLAAGGQPCTRQSHTAKQVESYVELTATLHCPPGPLRQTFTVLSVLPANFRVVLGSYGGQGGQLFADAQRPVLDIPERGSSARSTFAPGFGGWVQ